MSVPINLSILFENLSSHDFETRTATGKRIELILAHFDNSVSAMTSSFLHFKPKFADKNGVVSIRNENF